MGDPTYAGADYRSREDSRLGSWIPHRVNGAYLASFAHASIFYEVNVLLHLAIGLVADRGSRYPGSAANPAGVRPRFCWQPPRRSTLVGRRQRVSHRWVLWLHICTRGNRGGLSSGYGCSVRAAARPLPHGLSLGAWHFAAPARREHVSTENGASGSGRPDSESIDAAPLSMNEEGAGAQSPFAPSSAADQYGEDHPLEFLHGFRVLRPVPQRYLRTVEGVDAPLRIVQQSVLPEIHRVHART